MAVGVSSCVTCVNGVIYWDACGGVLAFDLNREVLTRIRFPLACMEFDDSYILQCKACVALLGYFYFDGDVTLWCIDYEADTIGIRNGHVSWTLRNFYGCSGYMRLLHMWTWVIYSRKTVKNYYLAKLI